MDPLPPPNLGPGAPDDLCAGPTFAWWAIRIEFLVAVWAITLAAVILFVVPPWVSFGDREYLGPLPAGALPYGAFVAMIVGLAWMVRIYRDLRREPETSWRYRVRR